MAGKVKEIGRNRRNLVNCCGRGERIVKGDFTMIKACRGTNWLSGLALGLLLLLATRVFGDVSGKPLFALRGVNLWNSHPFGSDARGTDDDKAVITC